MINLPTKIF